MKIVVTDRNREEKAVKICRGNLAPESSETVWCDFETTECGVLEVSVESIRRYDWFRIFYLTEEKEERSLIKIFPEYELIPMEITRRVREFQADDTEYAQDRKEMMHRRRIRSALTESRIISKISIGSRQQERES